ncbi:MAG: TonB-dependent receptor [Daejeonella sp.]|uniref:TonB-dependent receptor n=1 Tax=Daejeonella sp. TaxID=2805397 RepID=UPI0027356FE1|nr:TonB-dependent receptor [Daejeonella sp.]MDP3468249.1 TonB-dependent receptor [Daejeonella sp.]
MKQENLSSAKFFTIKPNRRGKSSLSISIFPILILFLISDSLWAQEYGSIKGLITSEKGELLSGVTVQVLNTRLITQSNREGEYKLENVPLSTRLLFSRLGYKNQQLVLGLIADTENIQNIILISDIQALDEVYITERFNTSNLKTIDAAAFNVYPQTSGSFENFIKSMPGVSGNNELSSQYSVRGGNFDENLIYLNDIEIYRPMQIYTGQQEGLGFINPNLASSTRFSAGGFEARYGDKMASILDVRYSKPDSLSLDAQIGFLSSSAALKVPFKNSYILAGVRNKKNQSLLGTQNLDGDYISGFSDYQFLFRHDLGSKLNLSVFGNYNKGDLNISPNRRLTEFGTSDEVLRLNVNYDGKENSEYKSLMAAITLAYNASNSLNFKWISSFSSINEQEKVDLLGWYAFNEKNGGLDPGNTGSFLGLGSNHTYRDNFLNTMILNTEFRMYKQVRKSFIEMGIRFQADRIKDKIEEFNGVDTTGYSLRTSGNWNFSEIINHQHIQEIGRISGFIQNTFNFRSNLTMAAGIRANYNSYSNENLISPRVSLIYSPGYTDNFHIRFSIGAYAQSPFYREIKRYDGSLNPDARAQRSYHIITGTDYEFNGLGTRLKFSTELYYKMLSRITPYKIEDLNIRYLSESNAKGYATGADLSLSGNFAGDLLSTFRFSIMQTKEDIKNDSYQTTDNTGNQMTIYPGYLKRPSDQLFNIGMMFQDRLMQNPTYKVHLNLIYSSSLPTGPPGPDRFTDLFKIPDYKRVDIGFSKDLADPLSRKASVFVKKYFQSLSLHAELFNLLNFKNTASYLWLNDKNANQYAVPNYLTFRKLNFRVIAKLKSR